MYDNIGKKIKGLAKAAFIVETIGVIISALVMMAEDEDMIPAAFCMILIGPLVAWVASWMLYGFGELIDKACDIERNTRRTNEKKSEVQNKIDDERVSKLENLRAQGIINEEEYQQAISNIR